MYRRIYHTKDQLCIRDKNWGFAIVREKNQQGFYDIGLRKEKEGAEWGDVVCLYENLPREKWRALVKNGELERTLEGAEEIFDRQKDAAYSLC